MKKHLLFLSILLLSLQAAAENPPATYQQFRTKFMNVQLKKSNFLEISETTGTWIAAGTGAALVGLSGYFLLNNQMTRFRDTVLIGGAAYIPVLVILIISEDDDSGFPYY